MSAATARVSASFTSWLETEEEHLHFGAYLLDGLPVRGILFFEDEPVPGLQLISGNPPVIGVSSANLLTGSMYKVR